MGSHPGPEGSLQRAGCQLQENGPCPLMAVSLSQAVFQALGKWPHLGWTFTDVLGTLSAPATWPTIWDKARSWDCGLEAKRPLYRPFARECLTLPGGSGNALSLASHRAGLVQPMGLDVPILMGLCWERGVTALEFQVRSRAARAMQPGLGHEPCPVVPAGLRW